MELYDKHFRCMELNPGLLKASQKMKLVICQKFSLIHLKAREKYINLNDKALNYCLGKIGEP